MQGLAWLFRHGVPRPLAVDSQRRWMLLDDVGPSIGWDAPVEERESVLRVFAFMQVASSSHLDALHAMGCIDRRPAWLARETSEAHRRRRLSRRARGARDRTAALARADPRRALSAASQTGPCRTPSSTAICTWTTSRASAEATSSSTGPTHASTHPFLDLIDVHREEDLTVGDRLRDAYLAVWADYASGERATPPLGARDAAGIAEPGGQLPAHHGRRGAGLRAAARMGASALAPAGPRGRLRLSALAPWTLNLEAPSVRVLGAAREGRHEQGRDRWLAPR